MQLFELGPSSSPQGFPTPRSLGGKEALSTHDSGVPKPGPSGSIWIWGLPLGPDGLSMDTGCLALPSLSGTGSWISGQA